MSVKWGVLAAILAALPVWAGLYAALDPEFTPGWPLHEPRLFLTLSALYPLLEEIVFRGGIQGFLGKRTKASRAGPVSPANLLTSMLFSGAHLLFHSPLWAAAVFAPSLVFGYFRERTGGLTLPVLLHMYYNAGYFWIFGA